MAGPRPDKLRRRGAGGKKGDRERDREREREMQAEFSGVESKRLPGDIGFLRAVKDFVLISHTIFFRNIGEDWNSDLDYVSSKTTPFWPEPKVHDQHVIRT